MYASLRWILPLAGLVATLAAPLPARAQAHDVAPTPALDGDPGPERRARTMSWDALAWLYGGALAHEGQLVRQRAWLEVGAGSDGTVRRPLSLSFRTRIFIVGRPLAGVFVGASVAGSAGSQRAWSLDGAVHLGGVYVHRGYLFAASAGVGHAWGPDADTGSLPVRLGLELGRAFG